MGEELKELGQQFGREAVYRDEPEVLQDLHRHGLPRSRHARHDDELPDAPALFVHVVLTSVAAGTDRGAAGFAALPFPFPLVPVYSTLEPPEREGHSALS